MGLLASELPQWRKRIPWADNFCRKLCCGVSCTGRFGGRGSLCLPGPCGTGAWQHGCWNRDRIFRVFRHCPSHRFGTFDGDIGLMLSRESFLFIHYRFLSHGKNRTGFAGYEHIVILNAECITAHIGCAVNLEMAARNDFFDTETGFRW